MKYLYLLIAIVIFSSCSKEEQLTSEIEKLNTQENIISTGNNNASINFSSNSNALINKVKVQNDKRIYGDLPDDIIALQIIIRNSSNRNIAKVRYIRNPRRKEETINNNSFRPNSIYNTHQAVTIEDGKIIIDNDVLNTEECTVHILGFQNTLFRRKSNKNFISTDEEISKKNSNLIWYGKCKLEGSKNSVVMNMLNGELHLKIPTICTHPALCDGYPEHCTDKTHKHTSKNNILYHIPDDNFYIKYNISIRYCVRKKEYQYLVMDQDAQKDWENNPYFEFDAHEKKYELLVYNHYSILQEKGSIWSRPDEIIYGDRDVSDQYYIDNDGQCNIFINNTELCSIKISLDIFQKDYNDRFPRYREIKHYDNIDNDEIFPKDGYKRTFTINSRSYLPEHYEFKSSYIFWRGKDSKAIWEPYEWLGWHKVGASQGVNAQYKSKRKNSTTYSSGIRLEEKRIN